LTRSGLLLHPVAPRHVECTGEKRDRHHGERARERAAQEDALNRLPEPDALCLSDWLQLLGLCSWSPSGRRSRYVPASAQSNPVFVRSTYASRALFGIGSGRRRRLRHVRRVRTASATAARADSFARSLARLLSNGAASRPGRWARGGSGIEAPAGEAGLSVGGGERATPLRRISLTGTSGWAGRLSAGRCIALMLENEAGRRRSRSMVGWTGRRISLCLRLGRETAASRLPLCAVGRNSCKLGPSTPESRSLGASGEIDALPDHAVAPSTLS
jgi:hypothetical protein